MAEEPILIEIDGPVAVVRLNRPRQLNIIDAAIADGLAAAFVRIADDPSIRSVVLSGAGRSFSAGGDLGVFKRDLDAAPATAAKLIESFHVAIKTMRKMRQAVIAAAHGSIAGGGFSLMLACDLAVAADDATFLSAYTKLGTSSDGGLTWSLAQVVGPRRALEIILLNETIDAKTALSFGLVNRLVPAAEVERAAVAMAHKLAASASGATGAVKRLVAQASHTDMAALLDAEKAAFVERAGTADFREGVNAFLERRPARFTS